MAPHRLFFVSGIQMGSVVNYLIEAEHSEEIQKKLKNKIQKLLIEELPDKSVRHAKFFSNIKNLKL